MEFPTMRLTRRGKRVVAAGTTLLVLLLGGVSAGVASAFASAAPTEVQTITVGPGDTLWGLAEGAYPNRDPRDGVVLLRELNPALAADHLAIGQRLLIRP
jgi:hypothetical protein